MFEQLDDPDDFDADEFFFAGTSRRFAMRRRRQAVTRTAGGLVCLALVAPAFFGVYQSHHAGTADQPDQSSIDESSIDQTTMASTATADTAAPTSVPPETFPIADLTAMNLLITGADGASCVKGAPLSGTRTDTIMVVRLDPEARHAAVLSFPRDLWVDAPGQGKARINSLYRDGDPQLLIDTLSSEFGVPVDHFIGIDFCGFQKLIDALGGVNVPLPNAVRDDSTGLYVPTPGCALLDGRTALAYIRSRHFEYLDAATGVWREDPSSDLGRIARQQDLLRRVLSGASASGILNPEVVSALYATYRNDLIVDTGMTIAKMIEFAGVISTINPADIRGYQIEATGKIIAGNDVLVWHKDSPNMQAILDIFRGVAPLDQTPASATSSPTVSGAIPASNMPATAIVPDPAIQC